MASGGTKVVVSAVGGNGFITILKFVGWFMTASPSLLAEAIHSLADTFNQILLLIGIKSSEKEASREFPVGHGRSRYVWNLVSAVGIFFLGFGITAYHGIHSLLVDDGQVGEFSLIGIGVLVISFSIEFYVFLIALKEVNLQRGNRSLLQFLKESDDPTLVAILLEDGVAVLGVTVAFLGILLGQFFQSTMFDIAASLFIALLLGFMAVLLALLNGKLLLGKSVALHRESEIRVYVEKLPQVGEVISLSSLVLGSGQVRIAMELKLLGEQIINLADIEKDAAKIEGGENPRKIMMKMSDRTVRQVGKVINEIEVKVHEVFPEISIIDLEVH